ncbi:LHFPL tetraspan subfamily member 2a protein-like [Anneissia japonica]|uniref:LHFPL tetraspan subfamily member 2a protein-like n=1 Tax=Anneissia japonica TaxID=1529436 RepID=UPI0014259F56|nr:LHFPL tetraspan subfamily member 2a protein-like [Anneissia japonica]
MCFVIVTSRSLLWSLLSIAVVLGHLIALGQPYWLIGESRSKYIGDHTNVTRPEGETSDQWSPSIGIFNSCRQLTKFYQLRLGLPDSIRCTIYTNNFSGIASGFWKASVVFYGIGFMLLSFVFCVAFISLCKRSICHKSIFTVSGFVQAVAGLFIIIALCLYPIGWGSESVKQVCGQDADPFQVGDCRIGWAYFTAMGSTVLLFVCSILSVQADISTSQDEIQDEINKGKSLICLFW